MCSFCSQTIEKGLMRTRGVKKVNVSLAHEEALIEHDPEEIEAGEIKRILGGLGYIVRDPRKIQDFEEEDRILATTSPVPSPSAFGEIGEPHQTAGGGRAFPQKRRPNRARLWRQ